MSELPEYTQTLNALLAKKESERTEDDITAIIAGLREQSDRWNAEQLVGSKKRVTSKQVTTPITVGGISLNFSDLKL